MPDFTPTPRSVITGTLGDDTLAGTADLREEVRGLSGNDTFQLFGSDLGDHFLGGTGNDNITGLAITFTGVDSYETNAELSFDGGRGYDTLHMAVTMTWRYTELVLDDFASRAFGVEERSFEIDLPSAFLNPVSMNLLGGASDETVRVTDSTAQRDGYVFVRLGGGDDHFEAYGDNVNWQEVRVNVGAGRDTVLISSTVAELSAFTGNGADSIEISASTDEVRITTGNGRDSVEISAAAGALEINTGSGDDSVEISAVAGEVDIDTGSGDDTVDISASVDDIRIVTGAGADTVTMVSSVDGARIVTGSGADIVQLEALHRETLLTGNGNDRIYVTSGNHTNDHDTITTGAGRDRLYIELDHRSLLAVITDFSAGSDRLVFNSSDISASELYFNRANAEASTAADVLYMDNRNGQLFYNGSLLIDFDGPTSLTSADFVYQDWLA